MTDPSPAQTMFTYAIQSSFAKNRQLEKVAENLLYYLLNTQRESKPLGGYLAAAVLGIGRWDAAQVATQTRDGENQPDVTITITAGGREVGTLILELKIDASLGDAQIDRYLKSLVSVPGAKALLVVARHEETLVDAQDEATQWQGLNSAYVRFFPESWSAFADRLRRLRLTDQQKADVEALLLFAEQAGTVALPLQAQTADSLLDSSAAQSFLEHLTFADNLARSWSESGLKVYGNSTAFMLQKGTSVSNYGLIFEPHRRDPLGSPTDFYCMADDHPLVLVTNGGFAPLTARTDSRLRTHVSQQDWQNNEKALAALNKKLAKAQKKALSGPKNPPPAAFYEAGEILWAIMTQSIRILNGKNASKAQIHDDVTKQFGLNSRSGFRAIVIRPRLWNKDCAQGPLQIKKNRTWSAIPPHEGELSTTYISRVLAELIEPPA